MVSRHLQWTDVETGIEVARAAGFPGIAWTVRPGAHIEPANVEKELPRVVELSRKAGLETPMVITGISDAASPRAEAILATMQGLGLRRYRAGSVRYDYTRELGPQFDAYRAKLEGLTALSARYGATAMIHTHSYANTIGGSAWDLWMLLRDLDPRHIGLNYDIGHVMAKGGAGWMESARAANRHIHALSVKDFLWRRTPDAQEGQWPWRTEFVPPGEGMVNFPDVFRYFRSIDFRGPIETYYEYKVPLPNGAQMDMLGTDYGKWKLEIPRSQFLAYLKRDVDFYKRSLREAGFDIV
ncbi:sugar phosphate isomerase/epimerase [Phenylobacterium sp. J367]|uniref:sugar phosphate isomerase/epimerase family protein n=1 Tax=Phenylobacterium sp. J367 TaxID=2898435 RepID=UPI00215186CE|nr:sugar phosphate isomerase/epimerase family protein [Phenylobacterium sp. J367]MCR5879288.1 sugar phosphate isomerase/epimerase [Phenylobacterium sp. J367]